MKEYNVTVNERSARLLSIACVIASSHWSLTEKEGDILMRISDALDDVVNGDYADILIDTRNDK